jgi:hypothetical protein
VNKVSFKNPPYAPAPDGWPVTLHRKNETENKIIFFPMRKPISIYQ